MKKFSQAKRFLVLLFVIVSLFTITACSNNNPLEDTVDDAIEENFQTSNDSVSDDLESSSILEFDELKIKIDKERAMDVIQYLEDVSPRIAGQNGEKVAGEYILEEFNKLGFTSNLEEFPMKLFKANECNLKINKGNDTFELENNCLTFSSSTPNEGLEEIPLVDGLSGRILDVNDIDMMGKIAVVKRGYISFKEKVINCADRGAIAVIIINSEDVPLNATLLEKSPIPAVAVSLSEGFKIMDAMSNENVSVDLLVDTTIEDGISNNVIGLKSSNKEDARTLIIGAHYDSVDCPGANDNASGVAGLMELAYVLEGIDLPFNIHFMAFGSEEIGKVGSTYSVNNNAFIIENKNNIIGMINMDMIGKGENFTVLKEKEYTDDTIYNLATSAARELNIVPVNYYSGRSDHVPFESADIPVVFLTYYPHDPIYYHTKRDIIDSIDSTLIENTIEVILKMITDLANE
ncbi:M28 family peptidase [Mycoplasmatota bacterium]|nr:M28 family peptidase [Mycoplasmatota bacterium]